MTIQHHPDEALLLAHAAGQLANGPALLLATHVEGCAHCQERVRLMERLGGALMDALPPVGLQADALARTLAAIDHPPIPSVRKVVPTAARHPKLPEGMPWPRALAHCSATPWRRFAPGMGWSRVTVPYDKAANVFLLRIGAGKELAKHTHSDSEFTQVLYGSFHDGRALFGPGDFDETDPSVHHQPMVKAAGECICLAAVEGRVLFDGWLARWVGAVLGM